MIQLPDRSADPTSFKVAVCLNVLEAVPTFLAIVERECPAPDSGTMWEKVSDLYNKAVKALISEMRNL